MDYQVQMVRRVILVVLGRLDQRVYLEIKGLKVCKVLLELQDPLGLMELLALLAQRVVWALQETLDSKVQLVYLVTLDQQAKLVPWEGLAQQDQSDRLAPRVSLDNEVPLALLEIPAPRDLLETPDSQDHLVQLGRLE